jgi:Zinc-finger associated domain (zf-AD)
MKQKKALDPLDTEFVKIFEFKAMGHLVADILIDFANINVDQSDDLPHIICISCFENLVKCREFKKLVVQNQTALADLAKASPADVERIIAEPLVRIEKVEIEFPLESPYSEDEDEFGTEEEVVPVEQVKAVQPRFLCCCCPLQFDEEYEVIQHMKTDHAAIRSKINIAPAAREFDEVKQCELCFKFIFGFDKLLEHQAQYKNCKQCFECGGFYQKKG